MSSESYHNAKAPARIFRWNDPEVAKKEFPEFRSVLREMLGGKAWVLTEDEIQHYLPVAPGV
jgi:hypothetical protein